MIQERNRLRWVSELRVWTVGIDSRLQVVRFGPLGLQTYCFLEVGDSLCALFHRAERSTSAKEQEWLMRVKGDRLGVVSNRGVALVQSVLGLGSTEVCIPVTWIAIDQKREVWNRILKENGICRFHPANRNIAHAIGIDPYPVSIHSLHNGYDVYSQPLGFDHLRLTTVVEDKVVSETF